MEQGLRKDRETKLQHKLPSLFISTPKRKDDQENNLGRLSFWLEVVTDLSMHEHCVPPLLTLTLDYNAKELPLELSYWIH